MSAHSQFFVCCYLNVQVGSSGPVESPTVINCESERDTGYESDSTESLSAISVCDDEPQTMNAIVEQVQSVFQELHQHVVSHSDHQQSSKGIGMALATVINILKENIDGLNQALDGKNVTFIGDTGAGKSWVLNLLLLLTQTDMFSYTKKIEALLQPHLRPANQQDVNDAAVLKNILECYREIEEEDVKSSEYRSRRADYRNTPRAEDILQNVLRLGETRRTTGADEVENLSFFLPVAGSSSTGSTTSVPISLRWGSVWHYSAIFYDEDWAKSQINSYLRYEQTAARSISDRRAVYTKMSYRLSKEFFEKMTTKEYQKKAKENKYENADDIEFTDEARNFFGKVAIVSGNGKASHADRCFVRSKTQMAVRSCWI